jgi:hypothetical protein
MEQCDKSAQPTENVTYAMWVFLMTLCVHWRPVIALSMLVISIPAAKK